MLSQFARSCLKLIPSGVTLRVLTGPMRSARWINGSHVHGCWLGTYERAMQKRVLREMPPDGVFYDIGANVGFFSMLVLHAFPTSRVVAFEPVPRNLSFLKQHLAMNDLDARSQVVPLALSDRSGTARFSVRSPATGGLDESGDLEVEVGRLDELMESRRMPPPSLLKIDVEGAEIGVLAGARATIVKYRPVVLCELHHEEADRECPALLRELGYSVEAHDHWPGRDQIRGGFTARYGAERPPEAQHGQPSRR